MKQKGDTLLDEIQLLLAKMNRAGDENDHKSQAVSLLMKCHRFLAVCQDDGFGPYEISENAGALYNALDPQSLKSALNDVANTIEATRFSRMRSSDSEFYELLV